MNNIILEVDNKKYLGFTNISVAKSMENASGTFSFNATSEKAIDFPIKGGSFCRVLVNKKPVITGFIEKISGNYSESNHQLVINGRDKTADLIDSTLQSNIEFPAAISLEGIIQAVFNDIGITEIKIINKVGDIPVFAKNELVSGSVDDNAFEFIEKYCRKRQVLITTDGNGDIVLTRASKEAVKVLLINKKNGKNNNIKSASWEYDDSERFSKITVRSQANPSIDDSTTKKKIVNRLGTASDKNIRQSRKLVLVAENSQDDTTAEQRAKWEINIRRARGLRYSCTVQGFNIDGTNNEIWQPNLLVKVIDDFAGIDNYMLIKEVNYQNDEEEGEITALSLVNREAYTLENDLENLNELESEDKAAQKAEKRKQRKLKRKNKIQGTYTNPYA